MNDRRPVWMLLDVSNWVHPDLHMNPPERALHNFVQRVELVVQTLRPEQVAFCYDSPSFREHVSSGYKANRRARPKLAGLDWMLDETMTYAIEQSHDVAKIDGFEADDLIATLTRIGIESERNVVIVSSDKDLRQCLLSGRVTQLRSIDRKSARPQFNYMTERLLIEKEGLRADQWIDYQTLVGDSTDCIKGCEGIGDKTAKALLQAFGSLDRYYDRFYSQPFHPKVCVRARKKLGAFRGESLQTARTLVTLRTDAPVPAAWMETAVA